MGLRDQHEGHNSVLIPPYTYLCLSQVSFPSGYSCSTLSQQFWKPVRKCSQSFENYAGESRMPEEGLLGNPLNFGGQKYKCITDLWLVPEVG